MEGMAHPSSPPELAALSTLIHNVLGWLLLALAVVLLIESLRGFPRPAAASSDPVAESRPRRFVAIAQDVTRRRFIGERLDDMIAHGFVTSSPELMSPQRGRRITLYRHQPTQPRRLARGYWRCHHR
jgi:hypothetical protein